MTRPTKLEVFPAALLLLAACGGAGAPEHPARGPAPAVGGAPPTAVASPPSPMTSAPCHRGRAFVLVRHAEKASKDEDTPLSERGHARAKVIASMLEAAGVTRLVATQYRRTQETLAPLGGRRSLPIDIRPAGRSAELVRELRASPDGAVVVVATHSNVLPFIARELSGANLAGVEGEALPDDDYARVVVITEPCGARVPYLLELSSGG